VFIKGEGEDEGKGSGSNKSSTGGRTVSDPRGPGVDALPPDMKKYVKDAFREEEAATNIRFEPKIGLDTGNTGVLMRTSGKSMKADGAIWLSVNPEALGRADKHLGSKELAAFGAKNKREFISYLVAHEAGHAFYVRNLRGDQK